ncbi:MAG TPA: pantoate--beta-alanine ligase [Mycobacteriales bacterium]|jgi:pantoate--beta-alanine ligase|nr:pantoate--beta-alanine ligase [Mycobacteriales bacterium]
MTAVVTTRRELAAFRSQQTGRVGTVMTMGALHDGHVALIRSCHEVADVVLVTVFVNPLQFGAGEDLDRYPRDLAADVAICEAAKVDVVFAPPLAEMYPQGEPVVRVDAGPLGRRLEGASRPGHFDGVLTVVAKLLHLIRPDVACFGEKDAQQLALIRRMVLDLDWPVEIVGVPTVREADGLALSSRNRYLTAAERAAGLALSRALQAGVAHAPDGPGAVLAAAKAELAGATGLAVDYVTLVDDRTWEEADESTSIGRLLVAARAGTTRLIDNVATNLGTHRGLKATEA